MAISALSRCLWNVRNSLLHRSCEPAPSHGESGELQGGHLSICGAGGGVRLLILAVCGQLCNTRDKFHCSSHE